MNSTHITYTSRPDTTPEAELAVLANTYRFVLDCHSRKIAAEPAPEPDGHGEAKEAWLLHGGGVLMGSGTSAGAVVRMRGR
jgi:hypothetical protein